MTSLDQRSDYYRLAYAIGAFARDNGDALTAGCLNNCCETPRAALGLHLAHVAVGLSDHPVASEVIATIDPDGLPRNPTIEQQGDFQIGYQHGKTLRSHQTQAQGG